MPGTGRYLRTNYRKVQSYAYASPEFASAPVASGFIVVSGTQLIVFKSQATYLVLSGSASGSIADL